MSLGNYATGRESVKYGVKVEGVTGKLKRNYSTGRKSIKNGVNVVGATGKLKENYATGRKSVKNGVKVVKGVYEVMNKEKINNLIRPTKLNEELEQKLYALKNIVDEKKHVIKEYPVGEIRVNSSNGKIQYRLRNKYPANPEKYISKKDEATIKQYIQKSYDNKILLILQKEIKNIETYLKKSAKNQKIIRQEYSKKSEEIKAFIDPVDCSDEDYIKCWLSEKYESRIKQIPDTEYKTDNGEFVRSKSELTIANYLFKHNIPYKYEKPIVLSSGITVHPDFTVLDVRNRKEIYWEHRGMMDDVEYSRKAVKKTKEYARNGIILGINLIITEETSVNPLGTNEIEKVVNAYFK